MLLRAGFAIADDCQLVEAIGRSSSAVAGSAMNLETTEPDDPKLAAAILQAQARPSGSGSLLPFTADHAGPMPDGARRMLNDLLLGHDLLHN